MQLNGKAAVLVAATPPSPRVKATPRRLDQSQTQGALRVSRDEGVAPAFGDGGVAATLPGI